MRSIPHITCLWPGLAQLWFHGQWTGLLAAMGFGAALNFVLVSSFLWPVELPTWMLILGWLALLTFWVISAFLTHNASSTTSELSDGDVQGLFLQAQGEYLRGHWFEAETLLKQLLGHRLGDVDAQLLLATLYRRTKRADEAQRRLRQLERTEGGDKWRFEIERERHLLSKLTDFDETDKQVIQTS